MTLQLERHLTPTGLVYRSTGEMPNGVIGQCEGVALVYDVRDTYGTSFREGCLTRTRRERVARGKCKLFWDHGDVHKNWSYDTDLHIGIVRRVDDRTVDGRRVAWLEADIFDTEMGRKAHEYLKAVSASGGETGLSINFDAPLDAKGNPSSTKYEDALEDDQVRRTYTEIPLREISVTAESAVPGTVVKMVRSEPADLDYRPLLRGIHAAVGAEHFRALVEGITGNAQHPARDATSPVDSRATPADSHPAPTEGAGPILATPDERLAFARLAFSSLLP